jgi:hypothetical protein
LKDLFKTAGLVITKENRKAVDHVIHGIVGVEYKNCSATWRAVKERLAEDEKQFINTLKQALVHSR